MYYKKLRRVGDYTLVVGVTSTLHYKDKKLFWVMQIILIKLIVILSCINFVYMK